MFRKQLKFLFALTLTALISGLGPDFTLSGGPPRCCASLGGFTRLWQRIAPFMPRPGGSRGSGKWDLGAFQH